MSEYIRNGMETQNSLIILNSTTISGIWGGASIFATWQTLSYQWLNYFYTHKKRMILIFSSKVKLFYKMLILFQIDCLIPSLMIIMEKRCLLLQKMFCSSFFFNSLSKTLYSFLKLMSILQSFIKPFPLKCKDPYIIITSIRATLMF